MTIDLSRIRLREQNFRTSQDRPWLDGLPVIDEPAAVAVIAGAANLGSGALVVAEVDAGAAEGTHVVTVTAVGGGLTSFSVVDPDGDATGEGVLGLPCTAGGITLTLFQVQGQPALAVGDTFALATLPTPVNLTGLIFKLTAMLGPRSATVMLQASSKRGSDGSAPTILTGGAAGTLALRVPQAVMARCPPGDYPYGLAALDPATGLSVAAFVGTIRHRTIPTLQD